MIKLLDLIKKNNINECTIVGSKINDKIILVKNRDRNYHPKLKLVHELINGIEILYMLDTDTDYSEGMNEYGIGIINATLQAESDENSKKDKKRGKGNVQSKDGFKVRTALGYKEINDVIESIVSFTGFSTGEKTFSGNPTSLNGHTFVGSKNNIFFIENVSNKPPIIKKMENNNYIVRTNHGQVYTKSGYTKGKDRESSDSRQQITRRLLKGISSYKEILPLLNTKHDNVPGWKNPRRYDYKLWTSSQLELNLTDLELKLVINKDTIFLGIDRRLPEGYKDKIKINVQFDY